MTGRALEGRVAIVTGAAGGIGNAISLAFLREGATVAMADLDATALGEAEKAARAVPGSQVRTVAVDIGDRDSVEEMCTAVSRDCGQVDILVNNAGIDNTAPLAELEQERWDEMLRVNLTGVFLCTQAVFPAMVERRWGRIISIGSQVALEGGRELAHYCAAKSGVHGLMRAVALEGAPYGVTANVIAPGPVETALLRSLPQGWRDEKLAEVPLGRFARPEEIAPTAVLLASDGGAFYTGATLNVSGGDVIA